MFKSIIDDIKFSFRSGNMITRLIIINLTIFLVMILIEAFIPAGSSFYTTLESYLAVPGDPLRLLTRPWTLITYMFIHAGFWHVAFNMLYLYWFGRITGDLLGDHRILPLYLTGGLFGAFAYIISYQMLGSMGSIALGASASVMAIVAAAGFTAPDYIIRLIFIGDVKLKFIVFFLLILDIVGAAGQNNTGGHIAHLGGFALGALFVYQLRQGTDIIEPVGNLLVKIQKWFEGQKNGGTAGRHSKKSPLTIKYKSTKKPSPKQKSQSNEVSFQEKLDTILDKIKVDGYDSLSAEEKEFLFQASKK